MQRKSLGKILIPNYHATPCYEGFYQKKNPHLSMRVWGPLVGMTRFERATTRPPDVYSTT